ncbi:synaptophysin / synaptoporin [Onchocerca flexuosa]|uniref:Synaptophysin / synaptoporin n=1 Tax=Onchocerca flexuosa TaxID=387005 RepID=A0A238BNB3_9BILA|nr:synaptophysin / synaptoporin [Onchocerca flexuosa]
MLKAEDLEQQQPEEKNVAATVEATAVGNVASNQSHGGQQSPPPYAKPAPSSPKHQQQKRRLKFDMSSKIQIIPNNRQGQLNTTFLATTPGVLKIAEIVDRNVTTAAWTEHISFATTLIISGLLIGYVCFPHLTLKDEATREGLIVMELIFYGISTLFFFIAIWLMIQLSTSWLSPGRGSAIMDAIICAALTILFAIETFVKLIAWRNENESQSRIIQTARQINESGRYYEPNEILQRTEGPEMA